MREKDPTGKYEFSEGRLTTAAALAELVAATGLTADKLLECISPLRQPNFGIGVMWASRGYNLEFEVGRTNAAATDKYIIVHVPTMDVAGVKQDMTGILRSHLIDTEDMTFRSFVEFEDAQTWLMDNASLATDVSLLEKYSPQRPAEGF